MRYAIVSDIHANRQAWNAVLTDIRVSGVDRICCLGDVVGYGPAPAEVLESVYTQVHHLLLGNHDAVICGKLDPKTFNEAARRVIDWTVQRLDAKASRFFRKLPLVLHGNDFRCVHAELTNPLRFGYVFESADAAAVLSACHEQLVFVGHTHVPGLFTADREGDVAGEAAHDVTCEPGRRYVVNVGSVGQPRDGDPRASYCIFDEAAGTVSFCRVPFDVSAYQAELEATGLPVAGGTFIQVAEALAGRPVRDKLDFHPPSHPDEPATGDGVQSLEGAVRRWRRLAAGITLVFLGAIAALVWGGRVHPDGAEWSPPRAPLLESPEPGKALALNEPVSGTFGKECLPERWTIHLGHPQRQSVVGETVDGVHVFRVTSPGEEAVSLLSPAVTADAGMRFSAHAQVRWDEPVRGYFELCLLQGAGTGAHVLARAEPDPTRTGRWLVLSATMPKRRGGLHSAGPVRLVLRGKIAGQVLVRKCSLIRRE